MTVGELIEELKRYPQEKEVKIGTNSVSCGVAVRVHEYENTVEIESDED